MTTRRSAPARIAGAIGVLNRTPPSQYSSPSMRRGGNTSGNAADAEHVLEADALAPDVAAGVVRRRERDVRRRFGEHGRAAGADFECRDDERMDDALVDVPVKAVERNLGFYEVGEGHGVEERARLDGASRLRCVVSEVLRGPDPEHPAQVDAQVVRQAKGLPRVDEAFDGGIPQFGVRRDRRR